MERVRSIYLSELNVKLRGNVDGEGGDWELLFLGWGGGKRGKRGERGERGEKGRGEGGKGEGEKRVPLQRLA